MSQEEYKKEAAGGFRQWLKNLWSMICANPVMLGILIIVVVIFIVLIVVSIVSMIPRHNPYGEEIEIENISDVGGLPQDEQDRTTAELYNMVKRNSSEDTNLEGVKARIREGTIENVQTYRMQYYGRTFVVDLDGLQQSYVVSIEWPANKEAAEVGGTGYPVTVTCLTDPANMVYENFDCHDFITDTIGSDALLLRFLPKFDDNYVLSVEDATAEKPKILANITIHSFETPYSKKDAKAEEIKQQIDEYIRSVNANPEDYEINYKVEYGD